MVGTTRMMVGALGIVLIAVGVGHAADLNKVLTDTEGRRKAAENGLKEIKMKSPQPADQIRTTYAEAASRQNAWLDSVCQAVEQGAATAPDVSAAAQSAATSLVEWVSARNRALGLPELGGATADGVKKSVTQDLIEIATATWKGNRSGDPKKRASVVASLKERLHWKTFEEVK